MKNYFVFIKSCCLLPRQSNRLYKLLGVLCFVNTSILGSSVLAQSVNLKDINAQEETTIHIKKGNSDKNSEGRRYELTEGSDEISGDPAPLLDTARKNWKKACDEWKKETKDLNKENQVLILSCGKMSCITAAMESSCTSRANYKLKVSVQ